MTDMQGQPGDDSAVSDAPSSVRLLATPAGIALGSIEAIAPGQSRGYVVQMRAGRFHGFAVRRGDGVVGYVDRCPHAGLPLARALDNYLSPNGDLIVCGWHSALFRIDDGRCVGGPCVGQALAVWPITVVDGVITTLGATAAVPDPR